MRHTARANKSRSVGKPAKSPLRRTKLAKTRGVARRGNTRHHDLDALIGTWQEDPEFDRVVASFNVVEPKVWE